MRCRSRATATSLVVPYPCEAHPFFWLAGTGTSYSRTGVSCNIFRRYCPLGYLAGCIPQPAPSCSQPHQSAGLACSTAPAPAAGRSQRGTCGPCPPPDPLPVKPSTFSLPLRGVILAPGVCHSGATEEAGTTKTQTRRKRGEDSRRTQVCSRAPAPTHRVFLVLPRAWSWELGASSFASPRLCCSAKSVTALMGNLPNTTRSIVVLSSRRRDGTAQCWTLWGYVASNLVLDLDLRNTRPPTGDTVTLSCATLAGRLRFSDTAAD